MREIEVLEHGSSSPWKFWVDADLPRTGEIVMYRERPYVVAAVQWSSHNGGHLKPVVIVQRVEMRMGLLD